MKQKSIRRVISVMPWIVHKASIPIRYSSNSNVLANYDSILSGEFSRSTLESDSAADTGLGRGGLVITVTE
jgi:hypothetical protein